MHAIQYFMGCLIILSEESARQIYSALAPDSMPHEYFSSRLLNRQIKYVMHKLHREVTRLVLEDLERSLRSRTKGAWGPSFCSLLVLFLCIEGLQIVADVMVVCDMSEKGATSLFSRDESYKICTDLDEYCFRQCKKLFHEIYRTHKADHTSSRGYDEMGFNPLKMAAEKSRMGLDACTEGMVRAIYGIVCNNCKSTLSCLEFLRHKI